MMVNPLEGIPDMHNSKYSTWVARRLLHNWWICSKSNFPDIVNRFKLWHLPMASMAFKRFFLSKAEYDPANWKLQSIALNPHGIFSVETRSSISKVIESIADVDVPSTSFRKQNCERSFAIDVVFWVISFSCKIACSVKLASYMSKLQVFAK